MRLIDVDRKPKVKYYVWAEPIRDNHFPGMTGPEYVVDDKYFDTIEEAEKLKAECDNNGMWEKYYIHKKVEPFEEYPTIEAIPIEWVEDYITMLNVSGHSDHEPELEEENKKKAQAIRGMLEYYELDKRISNVEETMNKIKETMNKIKSVVLPNGNTVSADDLGIDLEVKVDESGVD